MLTCPAICNIKLFTPNQLTDCMIFQTTTHLKKTFHQDKRYFFLSGLIIHTFPTSTTSLFVLLLQIMFRPEANKNQLKSIFERWFKGEKKSPGS